MSTMGTDVAPKSKSQLQASEDDREVLRKRRWWYYLALILLVLGTFTRLPFILLASIFTFLVGAIPDLWFRNALRHLVVRQQLSHHHLFFGEQITLSVSIENQKLLPLPALQVEDAITPALTIHTAADTRLLATQRDTMISTWLFWPYQRVTRRYRMQCYARGFHIFGPIRLYCSDPLGWLERDLYIEANEMLLVYPLIAPIEALDLPLVLPMGERIGPRKLLEDPLWFAGIREYELGDDPRRIDWKATARSGELRSKIYESTTLRRLLVLLDTWTYDTEQKGVDAEIQEFCISVAGSIALWGLDEGYMVGLLTNCAMITTNELVNEGKTDDVRDSAAARNSNSTTISAPGVSIPFSLEHGQYEQILSTLARLAPNYHVPIERIIDTEGDMFPQGTTIVLVSMVNTLSQETVEQLYERRLQGNAVSLLLIGDPEKSNQLPQEYDLPVYYVGGKEKWHELIRTVGTDNGETVGTSSTRLQLD